mmetsp:Transcript_44442/g.95836  ORF Transcript_44442/g.95836 Transcript_44442/m.95836 type:complete len:215 (-) Transcript_44442:268-912(-)
MFALFPAVLFSRLLIISAFDFPCRHHRLRISSYSRIVISNPQLEVDTKQECILQQQTLKLVDPNRGGLWFGENRIANLPAHEVLAVQFGQVIPDERPHVGSVDAVCEAQLRKIATVLSQFTPLFEHRDFVSRHHQLDGQTQANRAATNDETSHWCDARVLVRHCKVQPFTLPESSTSALDLVQALPHSRPLPIAAVPYHCLQLLVGKHWIGCII